MSPRLLRPLDTGFNPRKIAGLQLWLDAADASTITIDTGVSEWRDKSATGSVWAQATSGEQPATGTATMNGRNVLLFDGSDDGLSATTPLATTGDLTMFFVQRNLALRSFGMTYTSGTNTNHFNVRQNASTGKLQIIANNGQVVDADTTGSRLEANDIVSLVIPASGNNSTFVNGASWTPGVGIASKPVLTSTHYIGRRSDGFYANLHVAEIIAYTRALSVTERRRIERYLAAKWGITLAPQVSNADAQDWVNRVYAAGSTVSQPVANAVSSFVDGCQADGIWDAMKSVVLLAGADTLAGALVPLKGTAPTNNGPFVSDDYNRKTGLVGNGSTKWLNSNRNENADGRDDNHLAFYASTLGTGLLGGSVSVLTTSFSAGATRNRDSNADVYTAVAGFLGMARSASAEYVRRNGGASATVTRASSADDANALGIFANNANYATHRMAFYSIGSSLNLALLDTRVSALYTAIGNAIP
jgi:hypothetical protein